MIQSRTTLALGDMHQMVDLSGIAQTSGGNLFFSTKGLVTHPFLGGVFTQPTNIGRHVRNHFDVLPEEVVSLSYSPRTWLRIFTSYQFLYVDAVARPGDQINRNINATQTGLADAIRAAGIGSAPTGPAQPVFSFHDSSFWAQGISFGLEFRY
jgi:hypothetical protein